MRRRPRIADAKELCAKLGARGVIVFAIGQPEGTNGINVAGASYGETKAECEALAIVLDVITDGDEVPDWDHVADAVDRALSAEARKAAVVTPKRPETP